MKNSDASKKAKLAYLEILSKNTDNKTDLVGNTSKIGDKTRATASKAKKKV